MLRILAGHADRTAYRRRRPPLRGPVATIFPISSFHSEPVRAPRRSRWRTRAGSPPSAFAARRCRLQLRLSPVPVATVFSSASSSPAPNVPVSVTRAASGISTCSTTSRKKIHGDGRSSQPVPRPQRQPLRTPPPAQVSSRASARWRVGRASPSGTPSGRVPLPIAGRFRCPAQTPPGSILSLCRSPESFVVCSSIFSHFYARRRFLSHPTHLWCSVLHAYDCPALSQPAMTSTAPMLLGRVYVLATGAVYPRNPLFSNVISKFRISA